MIVESEKSYDLPSLHCKLRKTGGEIQSESTGIRTRGADGISPSLSLKAQDSGALMSDGRR